MRLDKFIIDSSKPTQLGWWAEYFEISEQALLVAIDAVGVRALDVQRYLHNHAAAPQPSVSSMGTEELQSEGTNTGCFK
jgi:hypothetical protein